MRFRVSHILMLLPILLTCACGTMVPAYQALPGGATGTIASTDVVVPIPQSEIYVYVPAANGGAAFGVLGVLADASINDVRTGKAENAVAAARDSLVDFNFDATLKANLQPALAQISWLHSGSPRVVKEIASNNLDGIFDASSASAVLFVGADYHLSNDGDVLFVTLSAGLFPRSDALKALSKGAASNPKTNMANAIYRNTLSFETKAPGATGDRDHDIAAWSTDKGAPIRAALELATVKLSAMLAADLQRPEGAAKDSIGHATIDGVSGQIVSTGADGSLVRFDDGTLKFATQSVIQP